jgi:hypothetical protein
VTRRQALLLAAVAVVAALNAWRWLAPPQPGARASAAAARGLRPEDFQLRLGLAASDTLPGGRNLFQPRLPPPAPPAPAKVVEVKPEPPPGPPPKTPEELAQEAARAEIGQIKLMGVLFRGEKGQAFLVKGAEMYMVQAGGRVGDRFRVQAIAPDSVQLTDPATRVSGQIPVSGQ